MAWRTFGLLVIVGAIWGLLAATRLLRREEDAGRWELFLAGRTARRHATVQASTGLAAGWVVLWTLTAAFTVATGMRANVDLPVSASLFYATAVTASAAMFLAIGTLTSQLASTRRQANGLAAAAFAVSYLIRMVADSGNGLAWMRWASPLGWVENLRPLTGSQPLALLPIIGLVVVAAGSAIALAGRRDVGAGVLARRGAAKPNTRFLGGPVVLAIRLERWVSLAWVLGLAVLALIFGVTAATVAEANVGVESVEEAVGRLGGQATGATAWIGYEFLYIAALVAFAAAVQISAMRAEEADGHLDNLLARRVSRGTWLAGRLGFGVVFVVIAGLATGIGGWIGLATRTGDIGFGTMLQAGLNLAVPGLFILGMGTLLCGLVPRAAMPILYGVVLWSFLIELIGSSITTNHWILDTALLSHLGPVPATSVNWTAVAWLTGLGVIAALAGLAAFDRRDLSAA
jgi:ABC-2 type transport system permease protein